MLELCTLFNSHYLHKGIALYQSLNRLKGAVRLNVLALDDESYRVMSRLRGPGFCDLRVSHVGEFSQRPDFMMVARRELKYWCWSLGAIWLAEMFQQTSDTDDPVGYIDADCFFWSSPFNALAEMGDRTIGIVPHRFPAHDYDRLIPNGKYNVSLVLCRKEERAARTMRWWRDRVVERCDEGSVGDQKYLDSFPDIAGDKLHEFADPGIGLAPWNISQYKISLGLGGVPTVDGRPVTFYHFHEFKETGDAFYLTGYPLRHSDKTYIYDPYVAAIRSARRFASGE